MLPQWEAIENKPQFVIYSVGAVAGIWFTSVILGAVDHVPLVRRLMRVNRRQKKCAMHQ